jgi:hypothetical protein
MKWIQCTRKMKSLCTPRTTTSLVVRDSYMTAKKRKNKEASMKFLTLYERINVWVIIIAAVLCTVVSFNEAWNASLSAADYKQAYEFSRAYSEAYMRTVGGHIDTAYVCKQK